MILYHNKLLGHHDKRQTAYDRAVEIGEWTNPLSITRMRHTTADCRQCLEVVLIPEFFVSNVNGRTLLFKIIVNIHKSNCIM